MSGTDAPKKPWYLVAALMGALGLGAGGGCEGHRIVSLYRADHIDPSAFAQDITSTVDRDAVRAAVEGYIDALGVAREHAFPLAVAALLIGVATVLFAMRAMGGSAGARRGLMQLVLVQAGLVCATYFIEKDVRAASVRLATEEIRAKAHQELREPARAEPAIRLNTAVANFRDPMRLAMSTIGSLLIVFALTRRGARAFFEASQETVSEQ
jgi:hypothetical protein